MAERNFVFSRRGNKVTALLCIFVVLVKLLLYCHNLDFLHLQCAKCIIIIQTHGLQSKHFEKIILTNEIGFL